MKRIVSILLAVILIFSLAACKSIQKPVSPPGSDGPSKPTSKEPPVLIVLDSTGIGVEASKGTYTWTYDNGDGTRAGVCADSSHPLQWQTFLVPMTTCDDTVELEFAVQPQEISIQCWNDGCWGDVNAEGETATLDENILQLKEGGYIYEVVATWTGENLAAEGTVYYGFYIIQDAHTHGLTKESQTDLDPVTGYCGNTMTTIILDGNEYTFTGSDSVNLTHILINLNYDPMSLCDCIPEFSVKTEFGKPYGVNLSQGYARCEEGQADLTPEQIATIQKIVDNQI